MQWQYEYQFVVCTLSAVRRHAMRMRHIVICGLPRSTMVFHISHTRHDFNKNLIEQKMCVFAYK